jgi:hypothetical protein
LSLSSPANDPRDITVDDMRRITAEIRAEEWRPAISRETG